MVVAALIFGAMLFWIALALYWLAPEIVNGLWMYFDFSDGLLLLVIAALLTLPLRRSKTSRTTKIQRL